MGHRILMLGGRRCGKSSILASIVKALQDTPGRVCTFIDSTDYDIRVLGPDGNRYPLPTLQDKIRELISFMAKRKQKSVDCEFLVDMTANKVDGTYVLTSTLEHGHKVMFEFVDVPGEWMELTSLHHEDLSNQISESDVFIVAIDTPYLMQCDNTVNDVANRISEITSSLTKSMRVSGEIDRKLIILCPVKCEKWANSGQIQEVVKKTKEAYRLLINNWVKNPCFDVWIMPIQTAGGLEHTVMRPPKLVFLSDEDRIGTRCSLDENSGLIILTDGKTMINRSTYRVEADSSQERNYTEIPYSWYKANDKGLSPRYSEQPAYHVIRFLVNKYAALRQDQVNNMNFFTRIKSWFNRSTWNSLGDLKKLNDRLSSSGLIKDGGDGFVKLTETIE